MESKLQAAWKENRLKNPLPPLRRFHLGEIGKWTTLALVACFFLFPLLKLTFLSVKTDTGIGLTHFTEILADPRTWLAVENTCWVAGGSTAIAVVIGVGLAWICAYTDIRRKGWIHLLALMPLLIPSYVTSLAWTQLAGPTGFLNKWASLWNVYGLDGIIVVMGLTHYPLVYLLTLSVLYRIPKELEWAARASGAEGMKVFRQVTLPLALPGIAGGGLLAFIASLDNFGIPAFLGIPEGVTVLSTLIYEQVIGFGPSAFARTAALSIILGVIALLGTGAQWMLVRNNRLDQTDAEDRSIRYPLGKKRFLLEGLVWIFLLGTSVVPLLAMAATSFLKAYGLAFTLENLTWDNFRFVLAGNAASQGAIRNSLALASMTTVICMVAGTLLAYWRVKQPTILLKAIEGAVSLPYALPGIVLALAMILTWIEPFPGWQPGIYGTIWMILVAYLTRFLILQVRSSSSAMLQIGNEVEEAARINGAGLLARWQKVLIPLYLPGILTGAFLVFLTSVTELTISSLLWSSGTATIGVVIFNLEQAGQTANSTAFSTVIVAAIGLAISLGGLMKQWWRRREAR
ncbi:ABC transporter permease [Brevibacillus massiliensis]|uniref:ABC transporter permease n=1 Tax=Brevibacillus massiliensis TaxID=1118054 RepID=UPI00036ACA5F|nr:iron ABC transporter permease [Brevibacillus massiliensis]